MEDLLKNTLLALYADSEEITETLKLCDFSKVNQKFKAEMFSRISEEEFSYMDSILRSREYAKYKQAIDESAQAVTMELAQLVEFALQDNEKGRLN